MSERSRRRVTLSTLASAGPLLVASTITIAVLLSARPHLAHGPAAWRGDELALGATWLVAIVCTAWLALTTLACLIAMARGRDGMATRIARLAPPLARRVLQAALVSAFALAPTAAHAEAPPAPLTLHVGSGGRLTTFADPAPTGRGAPREVPVVRTPDTTGTSSPDVAAQTSPPPRAHTPDLPAVPVAPPVSTREPARTSHRTHVVRAADNLWSIARGEVTRATGSNSADDAAVARYWQRVIAANRDTLRSGDPSLIFPGEVVTLPLD